MTRTWVQIDSWHLVDPDQTDETLCGEEVEDRDVVIREHSPAGKTCELCYRVEGDPDAT